MGGPAWKREVVPDHKFDFIDTRDFTTNGFGMRMRYLWVYILVLKGFLIYVSDIFTATTMLSTNGWSNQIFDSCPKDQETGCIFIPFPVAKWLFVGCIIFSFLLLAYEARKAKKIIASRDISYAFTNVMANHYYSLRSYDHFCFFSHIQDSTKKKDDFAFFIFFTFKEWKRILLADGPRQSINALTLYSIYLSKKDDGDFWDLSKYTKGDLVTTGLIISTLFTVLVFAGSLILLIVAGICYIPLLCYIRGNLKEYVCHKVDKRIAEVVKRKQKQRLAKQAELSRKEAAGDFSHRKNKKGEIVNALPQPTLPKIDLEDDFDDGTTIHTRGGTSYSTKSNDPYWAADHKVEYANDYPPMPQYQNGYYQQPGYAQSIGTLPDDSAYDGVREYEYGSTTNLPVTNAPISGAAAQHTLPNPHLRTSGGDRYGDMSPRATATPYQAPPYQQYDDRYGSGQAY